VSEARLILTCGLPGAGKTALAWQLAPDRSAVRLTKNEWLWALGSTLSHYRRSTAARALAPPDAQSVEDHTALLTSAGER
jgi:predicted kinase